MRRTPPTAADSLLDDLLEEITHNLRSGKPIDIESYAREHPDLAEPLQRLLPGIEALVDLGHAAAPPNSAIHIPNSTLDGTIGDYRIIRELGRGGMGVVYEAEQISLGRRVALKILPFAAILDERQLRRFKNEAQAAAMLKHPNIVSVYGIGCERSVHFYAMELIEGQSLAEAIAELRDESQESRTGYQETGDREQETGQSETCKLKSEVETQSISALATERSTNPKRFFRRVAELGIQAAEALAHAHEQGVLHRDVKPANLLLDRDGRLYVTDFGLARIGGNANVTATGDLVGTLRYMSPEQLAGKGVVVDHRSDVYSLGVTLYELATGRPAFPGDDRQTIARRIASEDPPPPRKLNSQVPPDLKTILAKAIEKDPQDRYTTAADLAADFCRFVADQAIHAKPPGAAVRFAKWSRRNRTLVGALMATSVVLACAAVGSAVLIFQAYQREAAQRTKAEAANARAQRNLQVARKMVDQVYLQQAAELEQQDVQTENRRAFLEQAAEFYESLSTDELGDPEVRQEAAEALYRLGRIREVLTQDEEAISAHRKAIQVIQPLLRKDARRTAQVIATRARHSLGWLLLKHQRFEEAIDELRRAVQLRNRLAEQTSQDEVLLMKDLDIAKASLGGALVDAGCESSNETYIEEGLLMLTEANKEALRVTHAHPHDVRPYATLATVHAYRAVALSRLERHDDAAEMYRDSIQACQDGLAIDPTHRVLRWRHAAAEMDLGRVLLDERHEQEQLQLFQRAMKSMRELVEAYPDRPFYRYELIDMLRNAAIFRNRRGLSDEATRFYRAAVQETESWMVEVDEPQREKIACQAALGINLNSLGVRIVETGDYAEAAELFRRACEHDLACAQWRAESRMPAQSLVQVQCLVRPQADVTSEDHRQALRCIERSLEHHNSAEGRYLHGVALLRVGRTNEALRRLEAVDHLKARFFLALAYYQLGKTNEARAAFEEANTWLDENPAEVKYYGNVRDEVAELLDATISEVATPNDSDQKIDP